MRYFISPEFCQNLCLRERYPDLKRTGEDTEPIDPGSVQRKLNELLSVSLTHLDSEAELRRFFGSKIVCFPPLSDSICL